MTEIPEMPISQIIDSFWSKLMKRFWFYSDVLDQWVCIPLYFTCDWESTPIVRGTSKVAGLIHDYLSRKDSSPKVSKWVAARVYMEFMKYCGTPPVRRWVKFCVVVVWPGYFHKKSIAWQMDPKQRL